MASDDDFFNSFGQSPPKPSKALGGPGSPPKPPPPPPRQQQRAVPPTGGTLGSGGDGAGRMTKPRPPTKAKPLYGTTGSKPTTTAGPSSSSTAGTNASTTAKSRAPLRTTRQPRQSRIASGGTQSQQTAAAASNSYYSAQPQKQQQQGRTYPSAHLTTNTGNSAAAAPSPAVFNPAAVTAAPAPYSSQPPVQQQPIPQGTNFYASSTNHTTTATTTTTTTDSSGDWFQPDAADPNSSLPQQQHQPPEFQQQAQPQANNNNNNNNPYAQSSMFPSSNSLTSTHSSLEGSMDNNAATATPTPTMFTPMAAPTSGNSTGGYNPHEFDNEPPLLDELGINIQHILLKTKAVVVPFKRFSGSQSALLDPKMIVEDADLAGPLAFALLLGGELLLTGKIHFGYIYGFGVFGCLSMTLILNLMSPSQAVSVWTVASILGYALLPVNLLAAVKILVMNVANLETLGQILAFMTVLWSTTASTRLLEVGCGMRDQRYLLAYPIALLYSAFVLITIF